MATDAIGNEIEREGSLASLSEFDPRRAVRGLLGLLAFVAIWGLASLSQPSYVLPSPATAGETFYD
jgi:NitT/TauT family transport system permease protein